MTETKGQTDVKGSRIAYLLRMYPRFSQTFIVNEIRELERQGLDLSVVSIRLPNEGLFHESVCRVKARAHYIPSTSRGRHRKSAKSHWRQLRRAPGAYWQAVRTLRSDAQAEWRDFGRAMYVLRWAKGLGVRHVHVHFGTSEATVALLAHMLGGLSYSLTLHAFDIFRDNVDRSLLAKKINASRFTVTVSEFNRRFLAENLPGVDPDKIRVNYNGIDLRRFTPTTDARESLTIFGLGRLKEKKGFIDLVRAVSRLHQEGLKVTCRIAGDGEEKGRLQKEIQRAGLRAYVELLGEVGEDRVRELMQRSSCFVLPCVEAKDGNIDALPTVLLEALASGCPIVSTRLSGIPEIVEEGVSGLLVEPGDDKALAVAVRQVLTDPELAASFALAGRQRAEERFDARRNVAIMREWLCAKSKPRSHRGESRASAWRSESASERSMWPLADETR